MTNTRTTTWNEIGTTLSTNDFSTVLKDAGLDYEVTREPIFTKIGDKEYEIKDRKAIVRNSDNHIYNVMSGSYTPIQNKDAFDFINYIDEDIEFVKAGETAGGLIYIIGKLHEMNILGDKFQTHVIFQNSHNGRYQLAMSICPLRIVCQNQFNIAFKESNSTFNIRHTKSIATKVEIASKTLSSISDYMKVFNEKAELFANQKLSDRQVTKFIDYMFPINDDMSNTVRERVEDEKIKFIKAYENEDNLNFKGSAWGLINGLTDYITHREFKRKVENANEKRFIETVLIANNLNNSINYISNLALA